jgi:hypothetical protein
MKFIRLGEKESLRSETIFTTEDAEAHRGSIDFSLWELTTTQTKVYATSVSSSSVQN